MRKYSQATKAFNAIVKGLEDKIIDILYHGVKTVMAHTPKRSGHLRYNWQVTAGRPSKSDSTARASRSYIKSIVRGNLMKNTKFYISNPTIYAWYIENGKRKDGSHAIRKGRYRGPANMVPRTVRAMSQYSKLRGKL